MILNTLSLQIFNENWFKGGLLEWTGRRVILGLGICNNKNNIIFQWAYKSPNVQNENARIDIELVIPLSLLSGNRKKRIAIECKEYIRV